MVVDLAYNYCELETSRLNQWWPTNFVPWQT